MPRLTVFDVDHTITSHSTGRRLLQCGRRSGLFGPGSLVSLPYHYVRYRSGTINAERAVAVLARLNGRTRSDLEAIAAGCYERRVRDDIMKDARECVEAHIRAGDVVVLATSSLGLIVKPLAVGLGVTYILATELEFQNDIATGCLATAPCYGEEKRDRVISLAAALRMDLAQASFYSDSHHDLPLLRSVGTPVAVNPDARLRKEAVARGWEVLKFR